MDTGNQDTVRPLGRRKDPFDRIRVRMPVSPVFESAVRGNLFYDPWDILNAEGFVYLLRFSKGLDTRTDGRVPRYYIGFAYNFKAFLNRLHVHANKPEHPTAARIVIAAKANGATLTLCRFWHCYGAGLERYLKTAARGSYARYDPSTNPKWQRNPQPKTIAEYETQSFYRWNKAPDPLNAVFGPA